MNKIVIVGRLSHDPEMDVVGDGIERVKFDVASSQFVGKDKENEVDFFKCTMIGKKAAAINQYFKKGDQIVLFGRMRSSKGQKEENKNTTYWNVNVEDFEFGAKKSGAEAKPQDGMKQINPDEIPF